MNEKKQKTEETEKSRLMGNRLSDGDRKASGGVIFAGDFLNCAEISAHKAYISANKTENEVYFYGGYPNAERKRIVIYPSYVPPLCDTCDNAEENNLNCEIKALQIKGSGYRKLTHRDYLGSLLSLGIKREKLGDIIVSDDFCAVIMCDEKIAAFILSEYATNGVKIANDNVKLSEYNSVGMLEGNIKKEQKTDTIASQRLDCIICALINESREGAKRLIASKSVNVNYSIIEKNDFEINENDIISIRGFGKFEICDFSQKTRKDKYRLIYNKYV